MPPKLRPIAVSFVAFGTFVGTWAVVTADVKRVLGMSDGAFGLLLAVALAATATVGAATGTLVERWGVARVLAVATGAYGAMLALLAAVTGSGSTVLICAVILVAFGAGGAIDVAMNTAAAAVLADEPGRLVRFHAFFNTGAALGAGLTALVEHFTHEWRYALLIPAVAMLVAAAADSRAHVPVGESGEHHGYLHALRTVRAEGLLLLAAVFACGAMVEGGIDTWGVQVLRDQLAIGIVVGALAQMVGQGISALARATLGPAAGSLGTVRGLGIGGGLAAGGLLLVALAPAGTAVVGLVIGEVGVSVCWPMLISHASQGVASPAGIVSGVTAIGYVGFVAGPAVVGLVADYTGLRDAMLLLGVGALVIAITPRFLRPAGQSA